MRIKKITWTAVRDLGMLVIGVAIVLALHKLDSSVQDAELAANRAAATECRLLVMFEQPISPEGPCADPEVRKHYKDLPVLPISDVVKTILTDLGVPTGG